MAGTGPQSLTAVGNTLYFTGFDATNGFQLWESSGTAAGTVRLTGGGAPGMGLNPQELTAVGSTLYFSASDGVHGTQLWSIAGTTANSETMLTGANVVGGGVSPADLTAVGGTLYFAGDDGVHGDQLWSSTGTAGGTAMVADINGTTTSDATNLIDANGTLYFAAYSSNTGFQVWQSDGTAAGTVMDTSLSTGTTAPLDLTAVGNDLYFKAPGATLWEWVPATTQTTPTITWATPAGITYGTALTSTQLDATASVPGTFAYTPAAGTVPKAGSDTLSVTFTPTDTTDYTTATATMTLAVAQATPTITWANPAGITYGTMLSSTQLDATASVPGIFVYSPAAGTVPAVGTDTLSVTFTPTDTTDYATVTATATITVAQATQGTTVIPINFGATLVSAPVVVNGEMFFAASDPTHGVQLWESNGTAAGTIRLTDGNDKNDGIYPSDLTAVGGTLYFSANDGLAAFGGVGDGDQLWKSDGTAAGTTMVTDGNDGVAKASLFPYELTNVGGTLYFAAADLDDGEQLFKSDGTAAGTTMVADIPGANGYPGSYPGNLTAEGSQLYFSASGAGQGTQLWTSNGTAAGTAQVTSGNASASRWAPVRSSWRRRAAPCTSRGSTRPTAPSCGRATGRRPGHSG